MLTLRTPIKTVLDSEFLSSSNSFVERITGNYMLTGTEISDADLLHVVTEPPEIFVMDGGMTSLFNSTNIENTQIQKTKIINNLINRILISADGSLSYQDNVYITNILHKLGIRDEKTFMHQVHKLTKETKEMHEAVNLYWENLEELKELITEFRQENIKEVHNAIDSQKEPVLHLHEEVNNRLQTAAIYRVMQNFFDYSSSKRNITNESYRITEQGRLSREILLSKLREEVRQEKAYLTYRHENYYEGDEITENEISMEEVTERVTSAVLLNIIDNVYENVYDRIDHNVDNWISTEAAYYGAAENTLFRIEQNTSYLQYLYEQSLRYGDEKSEYTQEIEILNRLIDIRDSLDIRLQQSLGGNTYETNSFIENNSLDSDENIFNTDISRADINYLQNNEYEEENNNIHVEGDSFAKQVEKTYEQNIVRNQIYMQNLKNIIQENQPPKSEKTNIERMQEESRLSLTHPEEFIENFNRNEQKAKALNETIIRESEKLLSPQQQYAHTLIRQYLMAPERFYTSELISSDNLGLLLRDIREVELFEQASKEEKEGNSFDFSKSVDEKIKAEGLLPEKEPEETRLFKAVKTVFDTTEHVERQFKDFRDVYTDTVNDTVYVRAEKNVVETIRDRVIDRWLECREQASKPTFEYENIKTSMVHKSKENFVDEEVIESIQNKIQSLEQINKSTVETVINQEKENKTIISNITNNVVEDNSEAITKLVNSSVKKQLDEISDKVYNKIEKQLKNERQRRGL